MSETKLSYEELLQIVKVFESSAEFNELHLKYGDVEIDLRKHGAGTDFQERAPVARDAAQAAPQLNAPAAPKTAAAPAALEAPPVPAPGGPIAADACSVKSPMVGTFYYASEPGAAPFVKVGQRVNADTTVCIIEVMKLMNSVQAGSAGVVTHILVDDGDPVEFGQTLIVIDPNG